MDFYNTIEEEGLAEFKDRGSRFLAYAFPFTAQADLKMQLQKLKKEHPKAVHFCFAYRLGTTDNNFRTNDNGEPAGTAGKPILGQIDSKNLTDIFIVVVRYFGGTLLGVPGLINAYKSAASMVLQVIPAVRKEILNYWVVKFNYTASANVHAFIKTYNCSVVSVSDSLFSEIIFGISKANEADAVKKIRLIPGVDTLTEHITV